MAFMFSSGPALLAATLLMAMPLHATEVVRLPDATRDALLAAAANGPEKEPVYTPEQAARASVLGRSLYPEFYAPSGSLAPARDGKVHGEMTMFAGSGGTVGFAGTAILPLGDTGTAAVSVGQASGRGGRGFTSFGFGFSTGTPVVAAGAGAAWTNVYGTGPGWPYGGFGIGNVGLGPGGFGFGGLGLMGRRGGHPPMGYAY